MIPSNTQSAYCLQHTPAHDPPPFQTSQLSLGLKTTDLQSPPAIPQLGACLEPISIPSAPSHHPSPLMISPTLPIAPSQRLPRCRRRADPSCRSSSTALGSPQSPSLPRSESRWVIHSGRARCDMSWSKLLA